MILFFRKRYLKAVLKNVDVQASVGANPSPSAKMLDRFEGVKSKYKWNEDGDLIEVREDNFR